MSDTRKLGFTFHRSFKLQRAPISIIIKLLEDKNKPLSKKYLVEEYNLGTIYAEAYPRYAIATGLIHPIYKKLSLFGTFTVKNDPLLNNQVTQWLMHYHISNSKGSGPLFWGYLVRELFIPKMVFSTNLLKKHLLNLNLTLTNKNINERVINTTGSVFVNSYISNEGLGSLGILSKINDEIIVNNVSLQSELVFGYAICDYFFNNSIFSTINFETIANSELKKIFLLSDNSINKLLENLVFLNIFDITNGKVGIKQPNNELIRHLLKFIYSKTG